MRVSKLNEFADAIKDEEHWETGGNTEINKILMQARRDVRKK